jgi:hypothetical protein
MYSIVIVVYLIKNLHNGVIQLLISLIAADKVTATQDQVSIRIDIKKPIIMDYGLTRFKKD